MIRKHLIALLAMIVALIATNQARAAILFESGTLGPTGIPREDVSNQVVLGENVNGFAYSGARFHLMQPVITSRIGGHFVGQGIFFGAIVQLDDENDFPDSNDLSTPDVLGNTSLIFTDPSDEVFGDIDIYLDSGWYAIIFGSGLFGTTGDGAALLNNPDIGTPDYIGFMNGFGWGHRLSSKRFVVEGAIVPEPSTIVLISLVPFYLLTKRQLRGHQAYLS